MNKQSFTVGVSGGIIAGWEEKLSCVIGKEIGWEVKRESQRERFF